MTTSGSRRLRASVLVVLSLLLAGLATVLPGPPPASADDARSRLGVAVDVAFRGRPAYAPAATDPPSAPAPTSDASGTPAPSATAPPSAAPPGGDRAARAAAAFGTAGAVVLALVLGALVLRWRRSVRSRRSGR